MTINQAFHAASDDYDGECIRAQKDTAFHELLTQPLGREYDEIDQALPDYVAEVFKGQGWPSGYLDQRIYQSLRMAFRMGMRVQRKLDKPEIPTTSFWRSDQKQT